MCGEEHNSLTILLEAYRHLQARNQPKIMGGAQSKILDLLRQF